MIEIAVGAIVMLLVVVALKSQAQAESYSTTDTSTTVDNGDVWNESPPIDIPDIYSIPSGNIPIFGYLPIGPTGNTMPTSSFAWKGPYDSLIYENAKYYGIDPALVKGIMYKESSFRPTATSYVFDRTTLQKRSDISSSFARTTIQSASDGGFKWLQDNNIDVSLGLMQLRTMTARSIEAVKPSDLYDPETNIRIACRFISGMFSRGITTDTIDAYNMGEGNIKKGRRNYSYRDTVISRMNMYAGDFPA